MSEESRINASLVPVKIGDESSFQYLEGINSIISLLDPVIGEVANLCIAALRENRLEVEARLSARLQELETVFSNLEAAQARETEERDKEYRVLCILLDIACLTGEPQLISKAMDSFRDYVRKTPTYTRNVVDLAVALQHQTD
jgi:hypothetical protein